MLQTEILDLQLTPCSSGFRPIHAKDVDRLVSTVDQHFALAGQNQTFSKGLCVLLGELGRSSRPISEWVAKHGATLMVINEKPLSLVWLHRYAHHIDFLMVDADYMDDTEESVDFCMRLRRAIPSLPLIMLSSEVRGHDLTCERMMACDVTVRTPVQAHILSQCVLAAYENHAYFFSNIS